jgi:hypothetical protein
MSLYSKQISGTDYIWGFNCAEGEHFFQRHSNDHGSSLCFSTRPNPQAIRSSCNEIVMLIETEEQMCGEPIVPVGQKLMFLLELSF